MVRLRQQPAVLPKGNVVINSKKIDGTNRPEYLSLHPPSTSQEKELAAQCYTTSLPTASPVAMIPRPTRAFSSIKDEYDLAKKLAIDNFNEIVESFEKEENSTKSIKKFFDSKFFIGASHALYPNGTPDECTVGEPEKVIRATEYFAKGTPLFSSTPSGIGRGGSELIQGQIGDGHLIAAMKILTADHFKTLIVAHDIEKGIYAVLFYVLGNWEHVIVDDLLACDENGELMFLRTKSKSEIFPVIIEKAFMKIHGSADAIDGGYTAASLSTLTGSIRMTLELKNLQWKEFSELVSSSVSPSEITVLCALNDKVSNSSSGISSGTNNNTAFGIPKDRSFWVKQVLEETKERVGFVRLQHLLPHNNDNKPCEWKSQHKFSNPPTSSSSSTSTSADEEADCFWVPAVDFRKFFVCDAVFKNDLAKKIPYYNFEGTAAASEQYGDANDTFMIKVNTATKNPLESSGLKLQFTVGQIENRFICSVLGESNENHTVLKGGMDSSLKSYQLGLRVYYHPNGVPRPENFELSQKVVLASRIITFAETVLVEVDFSKIKEKNLIKNNSTGDKNDSSQHHCYLSLVPIFDSYTPYFVTIMNVSSGSPELDDLSVFRLSDEAKKEVMGKKDDGILDSLKLDSGSQTVEDEADENDDDDNEDEFEEYWCAEGEKTKGPTREQLRKMFDQFDIDGSNYLDKTEMLALLLHFFPSLGPKAIQTKIKALDTNSDGQISFKEFKQLAKEIFA